ncbi:MAG TPA: helix-hairpin-helix domain-containing protein [Vicinamibacterales bacterium]
MMRRTIAWSIAILLSASLPAFAGQAAQAAPAKPALSTAPVNLNTASQSALEALPGVGSATARKIIAGRPYSTVADLSKAGLTKSTIDKITSMVTVGAATPPPMPKPAATPAPAATASTATKSAPATMGTPQTPPVKGMVWVNLSTKVFHREGDKYYGNTKNGKFMTEADAVKAGYREAGKPKS